RAAGRLRGAHAGLPGRRRSARLAAAEPLSGRCSATEAGAPGSGGEAALGRPRPARDAGRALGHRAELSPAAADFRRPARAPSADLEQFRGDRPDCGSVRLGPLPDGRGLQHRLPGLGRMAAEGAREDAAAIAARCCSRDSRLSLRGLSEAHGSPEPNQGEPGAADACCGGAAPRAPGRAVVDEDEALRQGERASGRDRAGELGGVRLRNAGRSPLRAAPRAQFLPSRSPVPSARGGDARAGSDAGTVARAAPAAAAEGCAARGARAVRQLWAADRGGQAARPPRAVARPSPRSGRGPPLERVQLDAQRPAGRP
ncbi:unnamed protein product, partial [Prorocentrum cordatum]